MIEKLNIAAGKSLNLLQTEFNNRYPGLRISFYQQKHDTHEGSASEAEQDSSLTLKDIKSDIISGEISLNEDKTIGQLEQEFETNFGLHIQVFRRSNNLWLQSITTDDWSLEKANLKGLHSIQK